MGSSKGITHTIGVPAPLQLEIEHSIVLRLRPEAARRGLSVAALVRDLLDVIAADGLASAVLDDTDGETLIAGRGRLGDVRRDPPRGGSCYRGRRC